MHIRVYSDILKTSCEIDFVNRNTEGNAPLIVGVGASAGGLEAFQELLHALDDLQGTTVIFVQHLDMGSETLLIELLSKSTPCPVVVVTDRKKVRAGSIYVCPPWTLLDIKAGVLRVTAPGNYERPVAPIDHFLHSLAEDQGERAVGVILSGTGSDGTLGLKAISDAGGMTFAQLPESARYDSMPRSAATTGVADHVLAPGDIAEELKHYVTFLADMTSSQQHAISVDQLHEAIPVIAKLLMEVTNHNFQHYKQNTLTRRIRRRMQVLKHSNVDTYISFLKKDPEEPFALFRELLISVTAFFRDPAAFEVLAETVIPQIFAKREKSDTVRIWVPGCATGEEAFTLAILCREHMDTLQFPPEVQIFATDIDERALKIGRIGTYTIGIEEDVSEARLKRFFIKRGKKYQVTKELRELVLFSAHNLISDPPFSRLDLISCRNLLIYLGSHLQQKLIPLFHYTLRPYGFLMLGPSENISSHGDLFRMLDAKYRISQRRGTVVDASAALHQEPGGAVAGELMRPVTKNTERGEDLMRIMQRIVLDEFAPKSVIVGEDGKILCASADMDKYLTVGTGSFQNNIIKMARPGLRIGLRSSLQEAITKRRRIVHDDLSVRIDGKLQRVMLTVQPMPQVGESDELFMVVFHDTGLPLVRREESGDGGQDSEDSHAEHIAGNADAIIAHLERELASTRDDLEKSIQEFETANEELKSSNEELLSLNEEMQSTNEELETSKEEIQAAANALETAKSDIENLLRSTQIATIFLDDELCIRSFTPAATQIYGLIPTDIGRPLTQLMPMSDNIPPLPDPQSVHGESPGETTIQTRSGRWFVRRVLPYHSRTGERQGIVVTFTDVTDLQTGRQRFASLVEASAQIVWETNAQGVVTEDSPSWRAFTGQTVAQWMGTGWVDALHPDFRQSTIAAWKQSTETGAHFEHEYPLYHHSGTWRWTQVRAIALRAPSGAITSWVGMNTDIHDRKTAELELAEHEQQLRLLLRSTAEGIYGMDIDGRCTFANDACARLLGYESSDELLGQHMHDLVHHTRPDGKPYPVEECRIYRAFQHGERVHADDELYWRADGTSFDVEYWSYPQILQGKNVGCVVTFLDISDRKKQTIQVVDREAHLRRVIDNTLGFIGVLDAQGILQEANQTALIAGGVDRKDVIGRPFWECYWWSYDPQVVKDLKAAIATALQGVVVRYDVEVRMAGDSRLTIDFMLAPVKDAEGRVTHLIPSGIDISERKWVEREVQQRVAQLDLALQSGRMGIWEWDIPVDHVTWSSHLYEMFGHTPESFQSTKAGFLDVVFPDDRPQLESMIKSAFTRSCSSHEVEFRVVRGDNGATVWTHCRGTVRRDEDGSPLTIISVAVDITERKQRELSLAFLSDLQSRLAGFSKADAIVTEASHQVTEYLQLSHLLLIEMDDEATQAHVISDHCRDETGSLLGVYSMTGFATESERRQLVAGFPMIVCDTLSPDRPAALAENFEKLNVGAILNAPCKRAKKLTFMLSALKSTAYEWKEHEVQLMRELATILRLKLERARAEEASRESETRFRDLADNISQFAWMADPDGAIFWYNQRWFDYTGTTSEEMQGWGWQAVHHPEHLGRVVEKFQRALASGETWEDVFPLRSKDGEYRWFLSRAQPIRDEYGKILRWFGTNTDVTETKQAEDALRANEEQMRLGIEVAKFAIARIDYRTDTIQLSREAARLYGIGDVETEIPRQRLHETFHPVDRREMLEGISQSLTSANNDEIAMEHRIVLPEGATRWLDIRKRLVFDRNVHPPRAIRGVLAARDITDQKDWEIELATSRERLTMAMTSARMGSYEWEPETDHVKWDEQHLAITGLPNKEMTGAEFLAMVHPDDVESNRIAIERTIRGEADYDTEFRIIRTDGQVRWLAARGMVVPATAETPLRFIGMNWDITEQKQIQEVIRLGEARLQRIIAGTTVGIAFASESGEVTRANDAALSMLGITPTKFQEIGFNWNSVVRPADAIKAKSLVWQLKQSGVMPPIELHLLRADNTPIPVMVSAMSVDPNSDEHVVFLVDLTEQKRYEQSLHQARKLAEAANESKSEFVANMSHEIRTPMTAVLGYADLLAADETDPQKLQYLQTIKRNGTFLLEIINDILDLSKIEAGKMEILKERFPVQTVVEDVRSMMDARATEKSLDFVVEYDGKIPAEIESDPKRLRQILVNLIGNAIKFTESGSVKLDVRFEDSDSGAIRFDVTDTGIGITSEQQKRLFQPFSQGDASVTRAFGGTGLGLAISRRLAQFLGGDIVLKTESGKGSTFSFSVGVGDISGVRHIRPSTSIEREGQRKTAEYKLPCHVLVVDDRRDVRFLSRRLLIKAGATVTEAEDGMEAVEFVKGMKDSNTEFDLVLLDMQMPRMDGYQTAKMLRQLGFTKPIIALTADAMQGDMNRCLESGCDDYLSKPIDSNALLEIVRRHTKRKAE